MQRIYLIHISAIKELSIPLLNILSAFTRFLLALSIELYLSTEELLAKAVGCKSLSLEL